MNFKSFVELYTAEMKTRLKKTLGHKGAHMQKEKRTDGKATLEISDGIRRISGCI
jgi:hypothetical protein